MIVANYGDKIAGFLQLLHIGADQLVIDLIAVDKTHQGHGIASEMIAFAQNNTDRSTIKVGTQVANIPSIRLYEKLGFRLCESYYVFHYHNI
jgi:ribosomal protein S18 acetylase RimI-like enzyme